MSMKKQTMSRLRTIVHELIDARFAGANAGRIFQAQGMADGYMRALVDMKVASEAEMLALIDEEQTLAANRFASKFRMASPKAVPHPA